MSTTKQPQGSPNLRRPRHAAAEDGCQLTHKGPIRRRARHHHATMRPNGSPLPPSNAPAPAVVAPKKHVPLSGPCTRRLAALSNRLSAIAIGLDAFPFCLDLLLLPLPLLFLLLRPLLPFFLFSVVVNASSVMLHKQHPGEASASQPMA
ncbi:hypothetical protein TgHK011_005128 [Trichoderma gracile]|nr:hypothetical protein TgHK011_005128 [Trichoderma gracile]